MWRGVSEKHVLSDQGKCTLNPANMDSGVPVSKGRAGVKLQVVDKDKGWRGCGEI